MFNTGALMALSRKIAARPYAMPTAITPTCTAGMATITPTRVGRAVLAALLLAILPGGGQAFAGPPYVTDDPEPTDRGHWEIYNFAEGSHTPGETAGEAGLDLNYGAARDLQLTAVIPLSYEISHDGATGMGVVELGAKYRVLHQEGFGLDLSVFPRLFVPAPEARFGPRHVNLLLPVWAQKDFGAWSVFGGGGYTLNPGAGRRDFWTSGLAITRQVSKRLQLGAEIYHTGPEANDERAFTGVNFGASWRMTPHWALLASAGPGIGHAHDQGQCTFYLALEATY